MKRVGEIDARALEPFRRCTTRELRRMTSLSTPVSVEAGRVLARQGSPCAEFTVIAAGTAVVNRNGYDVDELGPGEAFGEIPLVRCVPNPTTITAVTPMRLDVMNVREFRSAYTTMPTVRDHVDEQIDVRIHTWLSRPTSLRVFPAHPVNARAYCREEAPMRAYELVAARIDGSCTDDGARRDRPPLHESADSARRSSNDARQRSGDWSTSFATSAVTDHVYRQRWRVCRARLH